MTKIPQHVACRCVATRHGRCSQLSLDETDLGTLVAIYRCGFHMSFLSNTYRVEGYGSRIT